MTTIIYDVKRKETTADPQFGVCGFMSYARLIQTLTEAGEFLEGEKLAQIQFSERGVTFVFASEV